MNYGEIIKAAFWITLRNRFLWFFGFFAGGAAAGNFNFPSGGSGGFDDNDFDRMGDQMGSVPVFAAQVGQGGFENVPLIVALVALVLLIVMIFVILSLISQGALAESVAALDRGESRRFASAWRAGVSNFWRMLGYYALFVLITLGFLLVIGVPIALLVVGVSLATASVAARVLAVVLGVLAGIVLLVVVFIPLSIIAQYALRGIVVRRERVVGSIQSSYHLFRRNLGRSLLLWLIQIGMAIGAGIVLLIALLLVAFVLALPAIILALAGYIIAAWVAGAVAFLIWLAPAFVGTGALGAFNHSYWTLAYLRLTVPAGEAVP